MSDRPRDSKGRFCKQARNPKPLDPELVKALGVQIVPIREPYNILEALMPRITIDAHG
jgi:hypothetical protein